ncbi:MAG: hypothetical protein E7098_07940 [Mediterranea massiliensis]|nr:hypothetical protein [Mediterranea massiliensis]MBR4047112.1 hypothetical protein [Bacteroides sp.]
MKKFIVGLAILLLVTSCQTMKELFMESIIDPKTDTQVFVRDNDFEPYSINAGELIEARKDLKKKKLQDALDSLARNDNF